MRCSCATDYVVSLGRETDYERAKRVLNRGKHPTFVGRSMTVRNARNGGLLVFSHLGEDVGIALLNARLNVLLVLNVAPSHRGHGLGSAMLHYCSPTWIRALSTAAAWFQARGYVEVGTPKQGRRLETRLMVRQNLLTLAGRLSRVLGAQSGSVSAPEDRPGRAHPVSDVDPRVGRSPLVEHRHHSDVQG